MKRWGHTSSCSFEKENGLFPHFLDTFPSFLTYLSKILNCISSSTIAFCIQPFSQTTFCELLLTVFLCVIHTLSFEPQLLLCMCVCVNLIHMSAGRLHRRHLYKRSFTCLRHVWGWSGVTAHCQNRSCGPILKMVESLPYANSPVVYFCGADVNRSVERAWIELEGIEAIVKTASKAKFFIEFHSSCLEGRRGGGSLLFKVFFCSAAEKKLMSRMSLFVETRRSSENDSQSCEIPRFLKLGWSFKQLPKVWRPLEVTVCGRRLEPSVDFVSPRLSQLLPVMSDLDYLQDQHLLLSVKSCDGFESYG